MASSNWSRSRRSSASILIRSMNSLQISPGATPLLNETRTPRRWHNMDPSLREHRHVCGFPSMNQSERVFLKLSQAVGGESMGSGWRNMVQDSGSFRGIVRTEARSAGDQKRL